MNKDLFDNEVKKVSDPAEEELRRYDLNSFEDRLKRLKTINQIFPFGQREYGSEESFRIFDEAVQSFISGQYIATIILAQAFIERGFKNIFTLG